MSGIRYLYFSLLDAPPPYATTMGCIGCYVRARGLLLLRRSDPPCFTVLIGTLGCFVGLESR